MEPIIVVRIHEGQPYLDKNMDMEALTKINGLVARHRMLCKAAMSHAPGSQFILPILQRELAIRMELATLGVTVDPPAITPPPELPPLANVARAA